MARTYALLTTKSAKLSDDFGYTWAVKLFGQEAIDSLPLLQRGPHKGKPKGYVVWRKAVTGGWCQEIGRVVAEGKMTDAWIGEGPMSLRSGALEGRWLDRVQALASTVGAYLFEEGRARHAEDIAKREADDLAWTAEAYAEMSDERKAQFAAKTDPAKMAKILAYVAEYCA